MSAFQKLKEVLVGKARNPMDRSVFHNLSLIAFFAWVGLGADGLSSSCYGPEEAYLAIQQYPYLSLFVALASAITVFLISASYSQIIELFPSGGGGYLVASKLLSPSLGMIAGCALLIDYVLTITISIASGADALFSFLPLEWHSAKISVKICGVLFLTLLNMRGIKESVLPLVPLFLVFVSTHFFVIVYALILHIGDFPVVVNSTVANIQTATGEVGMLGLILLILRAYSMGAGTYTGIEAVSNAIGILREPKVQTAKRTMNYMAFSLAFTVTGLMLAYLVFKVYAQHGKTLNAVLFETVTAGWPVGISNAFVLTILVSEALLLFVAAQTGFLGGPSVLANMAHDRWFPTKFSSLSDRLVTQNGVLLMGMAAALTMIATNGSVNMLVVLYSINVFITFCFSQAGMVRHWWSGRHRLKRWQKKLLVNGLGLSLSTFILISVVVLKFHEGGWITLLVTGSLVAVAIFIKRHYIHTSKLLNRLNTLVQSTDLEVTDRKPAKDISYDPNAKTAVLLVNGFNGLGLHTLFSIIRWFGSDFKNFIFIQVGVVDAGNFKGIEEVDRLQDQVNEDLRRYVEFMNKNDYYSEGMSSMGVDVIDEIEKLSAKIIERFPGAVFFGGQLVFPQESLLTRLLHNHTVFALQRKLYQQGVPFVILPIRV